MNQINKLVNKIKDNEINNEEKNPQTTHQEDDDNNPINHLTEDNLDEYLKNVEVDAHSKELLDKYLKNKEKQ